MAHIPRSTQSIRPARVRLTDASGTRRTLAVGPETFAVSGTGPEPIFLGLGPDPAVAAALVQPGTKAAYLECPDFAAAMPPQWQAAIPADWERLAPGALTPKRAARATFYLYRYNTRLLPAFWGPVWARAQLALCGRAPGAGATPGPGLVATTPTGLLEPEILRAFQALGQEARPLPAAEAATALLRLPASQRPAFFLCVNGAGLDDDGLVFSLLAALGVPVAIWFVDNPFHVLGRFRGQFWQKTLLCATDDAFLPALRDLGAAHLLHLPLAAAHQFFTALPEAGLDRRTVFVGRSAFAGHDRFFAGCRPAEALLAEARAMVATGARPDFFWWTQRLDLGPLWPGKTARQAGCGADLTARELRRQTLTALAGAVPLTVFGDAAWNELLPAGTDLRPPVDYYGRLPGIFAGAGLSVNVTSPLLPHGLTQRHFDVFAAGGCLITDATPGLALFPRELTAPITFPRPEAAADLARALLDAPAKRRGLVRDWREHLREAHRFEHRLTRLLDHLPAPA